MTRPEKITSRESSYIVWPFEPLKSRQRLFVRVRSWGKDGQPSRWSEKTALEAGLLNTEDWQAKFITPDWDEDITQGQPAPMLRHEFLVKGEVKSARLYITSLGCF